LTILIHKVILVVQIILSDGDISQRSCDCLLGRCLESCQELLEGICMVY
jgi:hypothetical protein